MPSKDQLSRQSAPPATFYPRWLEVIFLLGLPPVIFLFFNPLSMNHENGLDPFFYTGYINNLEDLLRRLDLLYYAVRFGLILPARFFTLTLGSIPGYFAFRYFLALTAGIPLYLVAKRFFSLPVAILAYLALIASPWFWRTLLWDHPDASGMPFMMAALCLVLLDRAPSWWRDGLAGCCLSMAVNSNVFTGVIFGIFAIVYLAISLWMGTSWRVLLQRAYVLAAGFLLVLAAGYSYYWHFFGEPRNIFNSTFNMANQLTHGGMAGYRTPGFAWVLEKLQVLVPVLLSLCCLVLMARRRPHFEAAVCVATGTGVISFLYVHQFLMAGDTLQLIYYLSYALPGTFLLLLYLWQEILTRYPGKARVFLAVAVAATLFPLLLITVGLSWYSEITPAVWAGIAGVTLVVLLLNRVHWASRELRATLSLAAVTLIAFSVSAGFRHNVYQLARPPGVRVDMAADVYRVALQFIKECPKLSEGPGNLVFWYTSREGNPINSIQSTYVWSNTRLNPPSDRGMPFLGDLQMERLRNPQIRYLAILGETPQEVQDALAALTKVGAGYDLLSTRDLHSGSVHVYWQLVELTTRPPQAKAATAN
ncbi:MAG: hypothetical protein ABI759_09005 [Candidatus Solibacter sp.]